MTHPAPVQATPPHRPLIDDADFTLHVGDALDVLRTLPDESVHCVVTSPPYFGLRDYQTGTWAGGDADCDHKQDTRHQQQGATSQRQGRSNAEDQRNENFRDVCGKCGATRTDQQLGLEPTPEAYVARMVEVFREVRRVLRRDGTCWLNIGDSYAGSSKGGAVSDEAVARLRDKDTTVPVYAGGGRPVVPQLEAGSLKVPAGLKPKDLVGIPWRVAFALQTDGWYLRSEIIWAKKNCMPESVTDRPTKSHEQVFLLTRSPRYYFDADAIREPAEWARWGDQTNGKHEGSESAAGWIGSKSKAELTSRKSDAGAINGRNVQDTNSEAERRDEIGGSFNNNPRLRANVGRNARSVWTIATQPYAEAHFATFPEELPRRCIAAGTSEHGCCPVCGASWEREVETKYRRHENWFGDKQAARHSRGSAGTSYNEPIATHTIGWRPTCDHGLEPTACVVLDPFAGSGTVALVARKLGRRSIGIELNPDYAQLAARRLQQLSLLA